MAHLQEAPHGTEPPNDLRRVANTEAPGVRVTPTPSIHKNNALLY